jgi:DNA polymerase
VCLDYETLFSDDYTLKKMSQEAYIRDKRFEAHGAAVKWSENHAAKWYDERQLRQVLREEDWSDVALICWHAQFDGFILSHHYNIRPKFWFCPMSMSRLLIGNHISVSLDSIRSHFGLPPKTTPYNLFKGKHWHELSPAVQEQVAAGACDEVESIWKIFKMLGRHFPREEYDSIDTTIRMFTEPQVVADVEGLARVWETERDCKQDLLSVLNVTPEQLQSADKFTALLEAEGVEVVYKQGKNDRDGEKTLPAFAKTDSFMQELLQDEDNRVRGLAEARLGIKSSLLQTRAETLGWAATRGPLPVYLFYCGAHTTRWSGGDRSNWQNSVPVLNECIVAPDGYLIASPDASQIECRLLNFVAGQEDVVSAFREGRDLYAEKATNFYRYTVTRETHPDERQIFKVVELQCGYGSGGPKIKATIRIRAKINVSDEDALAFRDEYRNTHPAVTDYWHEGGQCLSWLSGGLERDWGPLHIAKHKVWLPNGAMIHYDTLQWYTDRETDDSYWRLRTKKGWSKIYGAKLVENVIQALARMVVSHAMTRIKHELGLRIFNMRHDDIGLLIPDDSRAQERLDAALAIMRESPPWLPGIPLDAEGKLSKRYVKI